MQMREDFVKEREIMNVYDSMRNQQKNEVQSLMAVSKHLGSMAFNASDSFRREKATMKTD